MSTTITPPPVPPLPPQPPVPPHGAYGAPGAGPAPAPRRGTSRAVAIIAIVIGSLIILGGLGSAIFSAWRASAVTSDTLSVDAAGVTGLDIDISAADLRVVYADVDAAQLEVTGNAGQWRLEREEDEISVYTERGGWFDFIGMGDVDRAVLTLPEAFADRAVDASLSLSAGSITADGAFGDLEIDLSAGAITVTGTANELDVEVSAGRTVIDLADVRSGSIQVSAGDVEGRLTGTAPREFGIDVSAGRVDLGLPNATYAVSSDISAGNLDNALQTSASASSRITVSISAGNVALRPID